MTLPVYHRTTFEERRRIEGSSRSEITSIQLKKLNRLLNSILSSNEFYRDKLSQISLPLDSLDKLAEYPITTKQELVDSDSPEGFAANLTYPVSDYTRFHRTSGTKGRPMIVLDTPNDWQWWMEVWQYVLDSGEINSVDRVLMAFSFGPFIGFWSAFDAVVERGAMAIPTGALSTVGRLDLIRSVEATVVFCTPSYAMHMADVAKDNDIHLSDTSVRTIVVAGEPGGSMPQVQDKIQKAWNAKVIDHSGASEVGPWGYADPLGRGIYVNEAEFIAEFVSVETGQPAVEGELSELILTSLGRAGSPVIRYQTGDLVKPTWNDDQDCNFVMLAGGVLGRTDDMMIIRGVNVFPTSIERILRGFPEIQEYRMTAFKTASMDQLKIEIEDELATPERVKFELELKLGFRVDVECVPIGSLPRFEAKGKRFVDKR